MERQDLIQSILAVAQAKVGQTEVGNNTGPIVDWAIHHWTDDPAGPWAAWCAGFVSTCYLEGGYHPIKTFGSLSCDALWSGCRKNMQVFFRGAKAPEPGDIIFYRPIDYATFQQEGLLHTGIVLHSDNAVTTIEGNKSNGVRIVVHGVSDPQIHGYGRLPDNLPLLPQQPILSVPTSILPL